MKARAARIAAEAQPAAVPDCRSARCSSRSSAPRQRSTADREVEEALLKEQQRFAVEALQRKATMDKVYDTLTFTDAVSQGSERTPQQVMAEEATKKLAERTKRQEDQLKLERRLAALKSEPPEQRQNSLAPLVSNAKLALAAPRAADAAAAPAPAAAAPQAAAPRSGSTSSGSTSSGSTSARQQPQRGSTCGRVGEGASARARSRTSSEIAAQCRACRERGAHPIDRQGQSANPRNARRQPRLRPHPLRCNRASATMQLRRRPTSDPSSLRSPCFATSRRTR